MATRAQRDGILIRREYLNEWAGFELTTDEVRKMADWIEHSSIPDAIGTIAEQLRED